ncbi:MAG: polysaccharide biosynthesis tyrosine autokinase, partial [Phycisphaeraceae bacterium]
MSAMPPSPIPPLGPTSAAAMPAPRSRTKAVDPLRVLRQWMWVLIALFVLGVALGTGLWAMLHQQAPRFTSEATFRVVPSAASVWDPEIGGMGDIGRGDVIERFMQSEVQRIQSEEVVRGAIRRPEVRETKWIQRFIDDQGGLNVGRAHERLIERNMRVGIVRGTMLFSVRISTREKDDAQRILNAIRAEYDQRIRNETTRQYTTLRGTFTNELRRWQTDLAQAHAELRRFVVDEDLASLESRYSEASISYQRLAEQHVELEMALDRMREAYQMQRDQLERGEYEAGPETLAQIEMRPGIENLNERTRQLRLQRDRLLGRGFDENHQRIHDIDQHLLAIEAEKEREIRRMIREYQAARVDGTANMIQTVRGQLDALEPKIVEATRRLADMNERLSRYRELEERVEYTRTRRDFVEEKLAEIRLMGDRPDMLPVQAQMGPTSPELTFPQIRIIVPGVTLLLLAIGGGLIFLREMLDQRLRGPADLSLLGDAELLGVVPDAREDRAGTGRIEGAVEQDPAGLIAEAFRQVRSAVLSKMDRRGYKTLMIVGPQAGSGASAVAQNLAASLAFNGRKVLVIDADFRRPVQHQLAGVGNDKGLIDCLKGQASLADVVVALNGDGLSVLPTGQARQAAPELLESVRFRTLLSEAEREYDVILIDAPPALLAADAQLLARHLDAMAVVVRADRDKRGMVDRMIRQLDGQRADVLGLVLNGVRPSAGGYFRRSYREFYRYRALQASEAPGTGKGRTPAAPARQLETEAATVGSGSN